VSELLEAGHQVVGLARSDVSAAALAPAGAQVHRGTLDDLDSLRGGAAAADGVIHLAYIHDFSDYADAAQTDRRAIEALGEALAGSNRPFVATSGMGGLLPGCIVTEEDAAAPGFPRVSEEAALPFAARGVHRARSLAVVAGGSSVALVAGLPFGILVGQVWGWRAALWLLVVLAGAAALAPAAVIVGLLAITIASAIRPERRSKRTIPPPIANQR
jgi:hypothetical protein